MYSGNLFLAAEAAEGNGVMTAVRILCGVVGILLTVYLLAELTPVLARLIDRHGRSEENKDKKDGLPPDNENEYKVYDPYEGQTDHNDDKTK